MATIFDRYGGFATVSRIVSAFYEQMLDHPRVAPYFAKTDMRRLIDHQTKFLASVMGGPASYSNEQLERVHAHLSIGEKDFLAVVGVLRETLEDFDLDESDIATVCNDVMNRKRFIVTRP
jgi:hemoglobin